MLKRNCYKTVAENKDVMKYTNMGNLVGSLGEECKKTLNTFSEFSFIWTDDCAAVVAVSEH